MTWSIALSAVGAIEAKAALDGHAGAAVPHPIAAYIKAGISALQKLHGGGVVITVTGNGHQPDGPTSNEVTSVTVEVRQATPEEIEARPAPDEPDEPDET